MQIPAYKTVHSTNLLKDGDTDVKLFIGTDKRGDEISLWITTRSEAERTIRPAGFTRDREEGARRYNEKLDELENRGIDVSGEPRIDSGIFF